MKKQIIKQIFFWCIVISLNASCTSITKLFPKEPRPFQEKKFDSEQWKNGDYQTRGEMAEDLEGLVTDYKEPWKKSADEVRQILGEPDVVTEAYCCTVNRNVSPQKLEMWMYYIQIEEDYPANRERKTVPRAFKLYFLKDLSGSFNAFIGEREGDHSLRIPVVGMIRF